MESSSSKIEIMKPAVLIKGGILLAVSFAGFIFARIATRSSSPPTASSTPSKTQVNTPQKNPSEILADDHHNETYSDRNALRSPAVMESLEHIIEDFRQYKDSKEREIVLMEHQYKIMLELNEIEFLEREISLLENEIQRCNNIEVEYSEILRSIEVSRSENEHFRMSVVKKLLNMEVKEHYEIEISKSKTELRAKGDRIRSMEDEIGGLKRQCELLMREKNEISYKLRVAEISSKSEEKGKAMTNMDNFGGMVEFVRNNELNNRNVKQSESYLGLTTQNHYHSKRRKLFQKFKRWVDKEKIGKNKCFRRTCLQGV